MILHRWHNMSSVACHCHENPEESPTIKSTEVMWLGSFIERTQLQKSELDDGCCSSSNSPLSAKWSIQDLPFTVWNFTISLWPLESYPPNIQTLLKRLWWPFKYATYYWGVSPPTETQLLKSFHCEPFCYTLAGVNLAISSWTFPSSRRNCSLAQ